ncbi:MAG: hypothetical protein JW925_11150 [Syntrophaceae bacterium]|nr:hypothetical protein [Syntrophaceae bacterium]
MSHIYEIYLVVGVVLIFFAVILTRWILRINHVIERLDRLVELLRESQEIIKKESRFLRTPLEEMSLYLQEKQNKNISTKKRSSVANKNDIDE